MSRIGAISGVNSSYYYNAAASGKRINKAADDAAGLAVANKLDKESGATKAGMENNIAGRSALNIADGALSGVTDYLQKIKELSVKAANGTNTKADKEAIQSEIKQYLDGIDQISSNTQYNTLNLLDGSNSNMKLATQADGDGQTISFAKSNTEALGIRGYDVTGDFDMSKIDDAIAMVSKNRSSMGASTNALESAYNYGANYREQLTGASSRVQDLDYGKAATELKKTQLLNDYQTLAQKRRQEMEEQRMARLFQGL